MDRPTKDNTDSKQFEKGRCYCLEVQPGTFWAVVLQASLFLPNMEMLYAPNAPSGSYGSYFLLMELLLALMAIGYSNISFTKKDLAKFIIVLILMAWSYSSLSIKYGLIFLAIALWDKIAICDMRNLHRSLIVAGIICALLFGVQGQRLTGFMSYSAPMFAFTLCVSCAYLLFCDNRLLPSPFNAALVLLGAAMIWLSETRVFMVAVAVLIIARVVFAIYYNRLIPQQYKAIMITMLVIVIIAVVALNIETILQMIEREGGSASSETRASLISQILPEIIHSPLAVLFGHGGGFAESFCETHAVGVSNLPLHQDFLSYIADYGLVGLIVIAVGFFSRIEWKWYLWLLLVLFSFHNILTGWTAFLLVYCTFQSLCLPLSLRKEQRQCVNGSSSDNGCIVVQK